MKLDLDDLEAFLAVYQTGSFHIAAERLALSQPSVTRRVQKLETTLDVTLFERTTRSVRPTLAAKRLRPRAEAILDDTSQVARALRDESVAFEHQRNLIVTLAIIPTIVPQVLPAAMRIFRSNGNKSRIRLLDMATNEVSEAVSGGDADFGISSLPTLDPGLAFEALFEDQMGVVTLTSHPLASEQVVSWDQLTNEDVFLSARNTGNRVLIDDAIARAKAELRWTYEAERSTTALALVAGGVGIALLPRSLVQVSGNDQVTWRPMTAPEIARPVGLLSRNGQSDTQAVTILKDAIRTVCAPLAS